LNYKKEHIDLFDRYLKSELDGQELKDFEDRLIVDETFRDAFELHQLLAEGIKQNGKEELKNLLKDKGKVVFWGENLWSKKMRMASVVVFLIFAGLFALVQFYLEPKERKLALEKETYLEKYEYNPQDTIKNELKQMEIKPEESEESKQIEADLPPILAQDNIDNLEETIQQKDEKINVEKEVIQATPKESSYADYNISVERKLRDTVIYFSVVELKRKDFNNSYNKAEQKGKMQLPSNNNNNIDKKITPNKKTTDSTTIENTKQESKKMAGAVNKVTTNYKIEHWKSPINYRGYSLKGNSIKLYGYDSKNIKIKELDTKKYIIIDNTVYKLTGCETSCPLQKEYDDEIIDLLLN